MTKNDLRSEIATAIQSTLDQIGDNEPSGGVPLVIHDHGPVPEIEYPDDAADTLPYETGLLVSGSFVSHKAVA